ncbi:MAG: hypothetical protein IH851_05405 [Armatimonadetes bacterium]|nr:hypothetical protein [Armatimonadota bacterium]
MLERWKKADREDVRELARQTVALILARPDVSKQGVAELLDWLTGIAVSDRVSPVRIRAVKIRLRKIYRVELDGHT